MALLSGFFLIGVLYTALNRGSFDQCCNALGLIVLLGLPVSFEWMLAVYLDSRVSSLSYNKIFVPLWIILGDLIIGFCVILTMTAGVSRGGLVRMPLLQLGFMVCFVCFC